MQEELVRAKRLLRLPSQPRPYFISVWVQEQDNMNLVVRNGALIHRDLGGSPQRFAAAQVRVGSYRFDNSQLSPENQYDYGGLGNLLNQESGWLGLTPLTPNIPAIRTTLWLVADTAYKRALVDFHKKKATQALTERADHLPDFSHETPVRDTAEEMPASVDVAAWQDRLARLTDMLTSRADIQDSMGMLTVTRQIDAYANTEGTQLRQPSARCVLMLSATTQAEDGTPLENFRSYAVRHPSQLPDDATLLADTLAMSEELSQLRQAEEFQPYTGPAILDGEVAGVFFHEALGHRLEGERQRRPEEGGTFKGKINQQVLPEFLSVLDDPTMERLDSRPLAGFYRYDDEGVPAQRVVLVDRGILKNYLMSRTPVDGFLKSNGHGRAQGPNPVQQPVGRMANLIISSAHPLPWAALKARLLEEVKRQERPYGLIIRHAYAGETTTENDPGRSLGGFQAWRNQPVLVYRVDLDTGREQLVRGVELVGTPLISLERVIATDDHPLVSNGLCGAESGMVPVSTVSPALLTTQVELQRTSTRPRRVPILPSPFRERAPQTPSAR